MDFKSSGEDNILYEREQSKDFRITDSTTSNENISKDSELWKIAGEINAGHFLTFGTTLRFPSAKLDHLKDIYPSQPQLRLYILLKKWCETVENKYGNHRRLLAKLLSKAEYKNISDNMYEDISDVIIPEQLTNVLYDVCFDTVNPNEDRSARPDRAELRHDGVITDIHSNVSRKKNMLSMLKELELEEFYPSRISLPMINEIIETSTDEEVTKKSIPWLILRKFMNLNYQGREADLSKLLELQDENVDDFDDENSEKKCVPLHPLDVFLVTFLCCDPILQQELVSKMFFCRLAVPLIYRTLEDKLIISKWAFRKILINRKRDGECVEDNALSQYVKTVSFITVGPLPQQTISKSKLINQIISEQTHFTFFVQNDCISFETKKLITNGMVEASWLIPSNCSDSNAENVSQDVVMLSNLRGDSLNHEEEARTVSSISDVIVVHIDINNLNNTKSNIIQHLKMIHSFDKLIIYGLECGKGEKKNKAKIDSFRDQLKLKDDKTKFIKVEGEIKKHVVKSFKDKIQKFLSKKKAEQFSEVISNIKLLGDDNFSVEGYTMAKDIMDFIGKQPVNDIFPLQGSIWKELCECKKALFRSKLENEKSEFKNLKIKIKQNQFYLIKKSLTLQHFTRNVLSKGYDKEYNNESMFLIAWMKSLMDERLRAVQKYKQKSSNIKFAPSFDLFIREMGQAFSLEDTFRHKNTNTFFWEVGLYPSFVSNMLQCGFPFELMDGDTGMVPLKWVKAVLCQLKEDIGDQNVYVISVLGIQSSGKSTLLNTMFGLHFAVSAGTCTRGVFMQLIKVTDRTLPFNYLLILDTEGIRAENDRRDYENELATFVIGLGNITILNIKGENTSAIEDFLQIAVYACLRLKMANKNIKLEQRCVFVHQNVCAHDAPEILQEERDKLMHRLDEMVIEAAKCQDRSDIKSFNQVIGIDTEKDIWYFPDLWQGEPPMATVTLGYSKKVERFKNYILHKIAKSHGTSYSITDTIIRIKDFLHGILTEDFVFSFRNSLEIQVYREMERYFQYLTWKRECETDRFIFFEVRKRIAVCTKNEHLDVVCQTNSKKLETKLTNEFRTTEDKYKTFVDSHKLKNIMEQYTDCKILEIQHLKQFFMLKGRQKIELLKLRHQSSLDQISERTKHEKELKEIAQGHVAGCKEDELSDEDTIKRFDEIWDNWLKGINSIKDENLSSVENTIDNILFEIFKADTPLLKEEIKKMKDIRDGFQTMDALTESIRLYMLQDDHITWPLPIGVHQNRDVDMIIYKRRAWLPINIIMKKIDIYISSLQKECHQFQESYAKHVFLILNRSLDKHNYNMDKSFSMTQALRAKLAVHIKMYIVEVFTKMNDEWLDKNNIKKRMQSEKEIFLKYFTSLVKDQATEVRMAQLFLRKIEVFVTETVSDELPSEVVKNIITKTFNTKEILMIKIMRGLVKKSDFKEFMQYIDDSSSYAFDWLTNYINKKIFTQNGQDNKYTRFAKNHITRIFEIIKKIISEMVNKTSDNMKTRRISDWCTVFEDNLNTCYKVTKGTFLAEFDDEVINVYNFKKLLFNEFDKVEQTVVKRFKFQVAENVRWTESPYSKVFTRLWGCIEKCPFCKESCQKNYHSIAEKHSCIQHRPPGVIGIRQAKTHMMAWMSCNCLVSSNHTFRCDAIGMECQSSGRCKGKCLHLYKDFNNVLPGWLIEPVALDKPPKYWSWFISKFQDELCTMYNYEAYKHKDTWRKISSDDAIESLQLYDKEQPSLDITENTKTSQ